MTNFLKKPVTIVILAVLLIGIVGYVYFGGDDAPAHEFTVAERRDLIQEVSVIGSVRPAVSVDLAFEKSGKISRVAINVGDKVESGQILIALENSELLAQVRQAKAGVESAKAQLQQYQAALEIQQAKLAELERGTRPEELQIAETKVSNAQKALDDAEINLINVKNKADVDLQEDYDSALTAASKSVILGKTALLTLTNIQYTNFITNSQEGADLAGAKAVAVYTLLGAQNAGKWSDAAINALNGGAFGMVQSTVNNPTYKNIAEALSEAGNALQNVKQALNIVSTTNLTTTAKTNLSTEKNNISTEIITISSKQQMIEVQKASNQSSISAAASKVNDAKSAIASAEDELSLKRVGAAEEEISAQFAQVAQAAANITSQEAKIKEADANVQNIQAQSAKTILRSPISGVVSIQDAKVGEIVSANTAIVSLISEAKFKIEANVPETDIAKIEVGNKARLTLDAYGPDVVFRAQVITIDPAETIIEGVTTYKTTLEFDSEDERIRSSMTANLDILTDERQNVIAIPQRAVVTKNGEKLVRVVYDSLIEEIQVKTGLIGRNGLVEITDGLNEGDKVVTFVDE